MTTAYLNGQFLPLDQARIPVLDRGYLFGDGVYEVIPCYKQKIFRAEAHLHRLGQSLTNIRMQNPLPQDEWQTVIKRLIELNSGQQDDLAVYIQVTRGVSKTRAHGLPSAPKPTVLAFTWPLQGLAPEIRQHGISAITLGDNRWLRCNIKSTSLLANVLLSDEALREGHNEAILHRDGHITEGASSNVFTLIKGKLLTPPKSELLLHGITREFTMEIAGQVGLRCEEDVITVDDLKTADEIWITSSTREIFPVTKLDDAPVGSGLPGPQWQKVFQRFQELKTA